MLEGEASCGTSLLDFSVLGSLRAVSYTHLDVYKRQGYMFDVFVV